ncbi:MAG: NUDIX hydrolase [Steroidobacteraceae bacterium]
MESEWLTHIKRLQALAATGLTYPTGVYDRERYEEIKAIAEQMLASLFAAPVGQIGELSPGTRAHPTPSLDVRGAVFDGERVLLVREGSTGRWTLPGGFAEIGLSAAENIIKEVREEACLEVAVQRLYAVRHKAKGPFRPDVRDFYKFYFLCRPLGSSAPQAGPEVTAAGYFALDALPELDTNRTCREDLERALAFHRDPALQPLID